MTFTGVDKAKLWLAAIVFLGAFYAGFYHLDTAGLAVRAGVLVGGTAAALLIGYFSNPGRRFVAFSQESSNEMRKIVWPGRAETLRMTGLVLAFVMVVALFLWVVDALLVWVFQAITF